MDNDNKIVLEMEEEKKSDVLLFLQEELIPLRQKKKVITYDLEKEYGKTRKNRNFFVWIVLTITVLTVGFASWFVIKKIINSSNKVDVTLEAFEDLNLRNLFDALSKTQDLYEKASKTKAELQAGLDTKLSHATRTRDADLNYIRRLGLSKKNRQAREQRVYENYSKAVKAAHAEYDEKIVAADLELKQYEQQLKSFDSANVEKAQEWEKQMDSERQVHEIEKTKISEDYENQIAELKTKMQENQEQSYKEKRTAVNDITNYYQSQISKLDPVVKDLKINSIVQSASGKTSSDVFTPLDYTQSMNFIEDQFIQELKNVQKKYEDYVSLNNYAETIPFSNSMVNILSSEQKLIYDMVSGLATTSATVINSVKAENRQLAIENESYKNELSVLKNAFGYTSVLVDSYSKVAKVDGIILTPSSSGDIVVQFSSLSKAEVRNDGSTKVKIYNDSKDQVGSGAIWFKQNVHFVSLDSEDMVVLPGHSVKIIKK